MITMKLELINPHVIKIIIASRRHDSINAISNRIQLSYGWTYKWIHELIKIGVFSFSKKKLKLHPRNEFYIQTLQYIKKAMKQNLSFYYEVLSLLGISYCFTKTDAVFIWTKGGYQIARSKDYYPIFIKIASSDRRFFDYYIKKLDLQIHGQRGIFYHPFIRDQLKFELCENIPVDPLSDTIDYMSKYYYNFESALEMLKEMYEHKVPIHV